MTEAWSLGNQKKPNKVLLLKSFRFNLKNNGKIVLTTQVAKMEELVISDDDAIIAGVFNTVVVKAPLSLAAVLHCVKLV